MEENRSFSLTNFIIKMIIVIIFILFTVWLLSLSTKDLSKSLNVLTDEIFSQNIDKMKDVGQSYFTTERLPEKVGDVKKITLQEMYDEHLILEVKDKNGNACSAKNSYVSIEKMDNEYQMKVYLECGEEKDYIIVIMGCYDYCESDICEKKTTEETKTTEKSTATEVEYEYKLSQGGKWTDYGSWSDWSKTAISGTNYRQVETKTDKESYTYDKVVETIDYKSVNVSCAEGYTLSKDKTYCYKDTSKTETTSVNTCPTLEGYTLVSRNGLTCNYSKTTNETSTAQCDPKYGDGTYASISGFTCYYKASQTSNKCEQVAYQVQKQIKCGTSTCGFYYETKYKTVCKPVTKTVTSSKSAYCLEGYTNVNGICTKSVTTTKTSQTTCPTGYTLTSDGTKCSKTITTTDKKNVVKACETGYTLTSDGTKCSKTISTTEKATATRDVTYYRYRTRDYVGETISYKWSKSNNDKTLINAGYVLTGKTR